MLTAFFFGNNCMLKELPQDERWSDDQYEDALEFFNKLMNCEDSYVAPYIKESLHSLEGAYRLYGPK